MVGPPSDFNIRWRLFIWEIEVKMVKKRKLRIFFILAVFILINVTYISVKEKVFHRLIAQKLEEYFEKRCGAVIYVGEVKGNIVTNFSLENITVEKIPAVPEDLKIIIKSASFSYSLNDLIKRNLKITLEGLALTYKGETLPLEFIRQDKLITLRSYKAAFDLSRIWKLLASSNNNLNVEGEGILTAEFVVDGLKLKNFDIELLSDDSRIIYGNQFKAKMPLRLSLKNNEQCLKLTGNVFIEEAEYRGELAGFKPEALFFQGATQGLIVDIGIRADHLRIRNESLDAVVKANLKLLKDAQKPPYFLGKIHRLNGTYSIFQNTFKIARAEIFFVGPSGKEARLDISGQTKVRRYKISALVSGTLHNSLLELSSKPPLSRNEIFSLLLFGKRINNLSISEERELFMGDITNTFVNKFFLGKAEAKIAQVIGVDDLSVEADFTAKKESRGFQMPSVEVGKYLGCDKVYGTYKVIPSSVAGGMPEQTIGSEYSITDNFLVKGERSFKESVKLPREDKLSVELRWKF